MSFDVSFISASSQINHGYICTGSEWLYTRTIKWLSYYSVQKYNNKYFLVIMKVIKSTFLLKSDLKSLKKVHLLLLFPYSKKIIKVIKSDFFG
jgi:hypothetical protein